MIQPWILSQGLFILFFGIIATQNMIDDTCPALIANPDKYDPCSLNSGITLKFSNAEPKTCGSYLSPSEAAEVPVVKWPGATNGNKIYTIVMVDPDAPNAKTHKMRYWIHWIITRVSGYALKNGKSISGQEPISYMGPSPPKGSGPHRYQIFIFSSDVHKPLAALPEGSNSNKRGKFSLNAFTGYNQFCNSLVAAYQFTSENK